MLKIHPGTDCWTFNKSCPDHFGQTGKFKIAKTFANLYLKNEKTILFACLQRLVLFNNWKKFKRGKTDNWQNGPLQINQLPSDAPVTGLTWAGVACWYFEYLLTPLTGKLAKIYMKLSYFIICLKHLWNNGNERWWNEVWIFPHSIGEMPSTFFCVCII